MSKTITWTAPYAAPVVTPSLQAGGSLDAGVTYYYRVVALKTGTYDWNVNQVESPASIEVSATTDTVNKTIRLTWPQVAGANYYHVFRTTTPGSYRTHKRIAGSPTAGYPTVADGGAGGTTFDDDGTRALQVTYAIFAATDAPLDFSTQIGKGCLTITGGDAGDPITLKNIYDAIADDNFCKYIDSITFGLLGNWYQYNETTETHFKDTNKTLILLGQTNLDFSHADSVIQFGNYDATNDFSSDGCQFIHCGPYMNSLQVGRGCKLYGCDFISYYHNDDWREPYVIYGDRFGFGSFEEMRDCTIKGFLSALVSTAADPPMVNVTLQDTYLYPVNSDLSNTDGFTVKGGYLRSYYAPDISQLRGLNVYSPYTYDVWQNDVRQNKLVNPYFNNRTNNVPVIYWNGTSYTGWLDVYFEFDFKVVDKNNIPVYGATVRVDDKDGNTIVNTTTDSNGQITTQEIKKARYTHTSGSAAGENTIADDRSPFTLLITKGGYETYRREFTLIEQIDWTISLRPSPYVGPDAMRKSS
jgi:hypothetical protein